MIANAVFTEAFSSEMLPSSPMNNETTTEYVLRSFIPGHTARATQEQNTTAYLLQLEAENQALKESLSQSQSNQNQLESQLTLLNAQLSDQSQEIKSLRMTIANDAQMDAYNA